MAARIDKSLTLGSEGALMHGSQIGKPLTWGSEGALMHGSQH